MPVTREDMQNQIFRITQCISQGPFPTVDRVEALHQGRVSHVVNVSDAPSVILADEHSFDDVLDFPIPDFQRLPDKYVRTVLNALHNILKQGETRVFIHCVAGQNRSPTLLWLFLLACGLNAKEARRRIEERTLDAVAGNPSLVDDKLIEMVRDYGKEHFIPHTQTRDTDAH